MAVTPEMISVLRNMIDEPDSTVYNDSVLTTIITQAEEDLDVAAADIWQQKSARFSTLVDTSESGSSRSMSQVHKNALAMAKYYADKVRAEEVTEEAVVAAPRTRTAVRK